MEKIDIRIEIMDYFGIRLYPNYSGIKFMDYSLILV
jgi:hypothetical protein